MPRRHQTHRAGGYTAAAIALVATLAAPAAVAHPLGQYVFRTSADQLVVTFPWDQYWPIKYRLPPYAGFVDGDYPFEEALFDRPSFDLYVTHPGSKLELVVVQFDPAVYVRDPADIENAVRNPGDHIVINITGTGFLTFPWWHIDESDPNYQPNQESYDASFYLRDVTGVHSDSPVYTFHMYPALFFCPADLTGEAIPGTPTYGIPDGVLTTDDFFYYLIRFIEGYTPVADMTGSGTPGTPGYGVPDGILNNDDFFYYLGLYALGC